MPRTPLFAAGLCGGSSRARHRQGALHHRRRPAHGEISHVFLLRQGRARTGFFRASIPPSPGRRGRMVPRKRHGPMSISAFTWLGLVVLAIWLVLVFGRGGFWRCRDRDDFSQPPALSAWPRVVAVVPARDEAALIEKSLGSLLAQDYPGDFRVDPGGRPERRRQRRKVPGGRPTASPHPDRLTIVSGAPLPEGWTGKVWAMAQGEILARKNFAPDYLLFTDADIFHAPDNLRAVVARAESGGYGLVSLMASWRCESAAEKWLIPAFTYFFQLIYPFRWVSDPRRKIAAAAGNLHAGARRPAGKGGRRRGDLQRFDRRLRFRRPDEKYGADLARPDPSPALAAVLSAFRRHSPHGVALGFRAIAFFISVAGVDQPRPRPDLFRSRSPRLFRRRPRGDCSGSRLMR